MKDSSKYDYPIEVVRQVIKDIENNPFAHNHPKELVEECLKIAKEIKAETMKNSISTMSQNIAFIQSTLLHNNPFKELFKQNEIFKLAQQFNRIKESLPSLYGSVYGNFTQFSEMGWYLSNRIFNEISLLELARLFQKEDKTELLDLVVNEAEKMIPEILDNCRQDFENRKQIFSEIENAFNNGNYYSVVVLAYTQADGICNDVFDTGFFDTELTDPALRRKAIKEPEDYQLSAWGKVKDLEWNHSISVIEQLMIRENEISAHSKSGKYLDPEYRKSSYNRHLIMHGHSTEYGTKENAIRAICILDFLHLIITEAVEVE